MDKYELGGVLGLLILVVALAMVLVPVIGEAMYFVITNWFGHEIDQTLYWTGIGLLSVFTLVVSSRSKEDN